MHDGADQMIMDREAVVRSWMTDVLSTGGIDRLDDLYIDRIDPGWKDRERWLEAGLEAFRVAIALRDKGHLPVNVTLAFSLVAGKKSRGVDFKNASELKASLDWSPPSLYLLHPGTMPWDTPNTGVPVKVATKKIDSSLLGASSPVKGCWFIEFKQSDSIEFARTVFLID